MLHTSQSSTPLISDEVLFEFEFINRMRKVDMYNYAGIGKLAAACGFVVLSEICNAPQSFLRISAVYRRTTIDVVKFKHWYDNLGPALRSLIVV